MEDNHYPFLSKGFRFLFNVHKWQNATRIGSIKICYQGLEFHYFLWMKSVYDCFCSNNMLTTSYKSYRTFDVDKDQPKTEQLSSNWRLLIQKMDCNLGKLLHEFLDQV